MWTQNFSLAEQLLRRSGTARKFPTISDDNISLSDFGDFSEEISRVKTLCLSAQANTVHNNNDRDRDKQLNKISRLAKLWLPLGKSFSLSGVNTGKEIVREEPRRTLALGEAWQPTFNPKPFNEVQANTFLSKVGFIGSYGNAVPPDIWTYRRTVAHHGDTQPVPDTLPYSAWRATGDAGIYSLLEVDVLLRSGNLPPITFNTSGASFLPKGSEEHDWIEVIREPLQTRPISTKNTDNKLIMSANVLELTPTFKNITHPSQNGFVRGRNFLNNILDIDTAGRLYSMKYESSDNKQSVSNIPISTALDFETAFPSIIHAWIWAFLRHRSLPQHFLNLFKGLYHNATATYTHNGNTYTLIWFMSGVLQGCPGSAFLFNNALDPFLYTMHKVLRSHNAGIVRACADDIGASLRRLASLGRLYPIFQEAQTLGGLTLKPPKCIIVPSAISLMKLLIKLRGG